MEPNFNAVWSRVTGGGAVGEQAALAHFIAQETADAARYTALAARTGSPQAKRLFTAHAADERAHAKRLQAVHYLMTGDSYRPPHAPQEECVSLLEAVRRCHAGETAGAKAYVTAADAAQDEALRALYGELHTAEAQHAEALRKLLEQLL